MSIHSRAPRQSALRLSSLALSVATILGAAAAQAQESSLQEIVVTATPLRESPLEMAQPTAIVSGATLKRVGSPP